MSLAQSSFNEAVEARAEQHASALQSRLLTCTIENQVKALSTIAAQMSECEVRMQKKLEELMAAA
ncbi:hypothetical protein PC128_g8234 [Phytophthora cactorum]|nr:hypothetical protein PC128_g8234 [Phytophthora cactorum]